MNAAADLTWLDFAWFVATDALSRPAPDAATEPEPIFDAAMRAHLTAGGRDITPFAERVCEHCGATGKAPCVTPGGKVLRRYHVARG